MRYVRGKVRAARPLYVETPLWGDDEPHRPCITVDEHNAVDTGLVWASGEPIMRAPNPMGFGKDGEW